MPYAFELTNDSGIGIIEDSTNKNYVLIVTYQSGEKDRIIRCHKGLLSDLAKFFLDAPKFFQ